jgi:chromosome segregation ATPase
VTMSMHQRQPSDLPAWLQRALFGALPTPEPPEPRPDPFATLRAEFQAAITTERDERQALVIELGKVKAAGAETERDLKATQKDLAIARDYGKQQARTIVLMDSTIKSLQTGAERNTAELTALLGSNGALQEALRRLEADHKIDQETIALLRERLHTMEKEMEGLRDERAKNRGQIAGLQLAVDDLQARLDLAYTRLKEAGLNVEGLT